MLLLHKYVILHVTATVGCRKCIIYNTETKKLYCNLQLKILNKFFNYY